MRGGDPAGAGGPVEGGMGGTPPMLSVVASDGAEDETDMMAQIQGRRGPSKWIQNAADTRTSALSDVHV